MAPDFALRDQHGELVSRDSLRGSPALLVFYPFAFSGICSSELAGLRDHHDAFEAAEARVLGVSCDPVYALRVFADRDELGFSLLSDFWPHGEAARAFDCFDDESGAAARHSYLLDAESQVVWSLEHGMGEPRSVELHLAALDALPT